MTLSHTALGGLSSRHPANCGRLSASSRPLFHSGISRFRSPRVVGQSYAGANTSGASTTSLNLPGAAVPGLFSGHNSARGRIGDVDGHAVTTNQHDASAPIGPFVLAAPQTPGAAGATGSTPGGYL